MNGFTLALDHSSMELRTDEITYKVTAVAPINEALAKRALVLLAYAEQFHGEQVENIQKSLKAALSGQMAEAQRLLDLTTPEGMANSLGVVI